MKKILLLASLVLTLFMSACDKDKGKTENPQPTEKDKILVNYPWRMSTVTDTTGKDIAISRLNTQTQAIKQVMDIQFLQNNVTKAIDQRSKQVINGGTWYLLKEGSILDIKISGFAGEFGVEELTNNKMRLKSTMPVDGVDQKTIMVFEPVI
jgi:hypothetical protein